MAVAIRAYLSPTLVLLAFDWPEGRTRDDFLGFAIQRSPGFWNAAGTERASQSWLPNRIGFNGPARDPQMDLDSREAPIQKFMWWDARIDPPDRGRPFAYTIWPVCGSAESHSIVEGEKAQVRVRLPEHVEEGIGTWFNRAVLSSQAFSRKLRAMGLSQDQTPPPDKALQLRRWLANDLEQSIDEVFDGARHAVAAAYHLSDELWVIPRIERFAKTYGEGRTAIVYDAHAENSGLDDPALAPLAPQVAFHPRDRTRIMHDKIIVTDDVGKPTVPARVLCGSANFTTGGLTTQANLLHVFESTELAKLYEARVRALSMNPPRAETAALSPGWSEPIHIGDATLRVNFSPEAFGRRTQIDTIVRAIRDAKRSVLFCLFTPTDMELRHACFDAGDRGLMMFGLVNRIVRRHAEAAVDGAAAHSGAGPDAPEGNAPEGNAPDGSVTEGESSLNRQALASLEIYHRSKDKRDVIDGAYFSNATVPDGFSPELVLFPGEDRPPYPPVIIHHKFIVIDAEGAHPIVYTGSANMSENSEHYNDENLLEIRDGRIAGIYMAEFMRLYEHYRARAIAIDAQRDAGQRRKLQLSGNRQWADKYYVPGSPEMKSREHMVGEGSSLRSEADPSADIPEVPSARAGGSPPRPTPPTADRR